MGPLYFLANGDFAGHDCRGGSVAGQESMQDRQARGQEEPQDEAQARAPGTARRDVRPAMHEEERDEARGCRGKAGRFPGHDEDVDFGNRSS